jgi:hypothetical protein
MNEIEQAIAWFKSGTWRSDITTTMAVSMAVDALREKAERDNPKTQADRIRAMTDEELAQWMLGGMSAFGCECDYCDNYSEWAPHCESRDNHDCLPAMLNLLRHEPKQPAKPDPEYVAPYDKD